MSEAGDDIGELGAPEYLVYRVLVDRDNQNNRETSRTRIHKLCCLADLRLREAYDRDIGLPRHWDLYGRVTEEHSINRNVIFAPNANTFGGQAYYPADQVGESDFDHLDESLRQDIFSAVRDTVKEHGHKTAEELQKFQYRNYAPNDFIRAYADLRWHLQALSLEQHEQRQSAFYDFEAEETKTDVEELLDEMLVNFPKEEYEIIYEPYLIWDDTMRLMGEQEARPREQLDFLEFFIQKISKIVLRFVHRENVPDHRIERWEEERQEHLEELRSHVEQVREQLLKDRPLSGVLESVSESYNETVLEHITDPE